MNTAPVYTAWYHWEQEESIRRKAAKKGLKVAWAHITLTSSSGSPFIRRAIVVVKKGLPHSGIRVSSNGAVTFLPHKIEKGWVLELP